MRYPTSPEGKSSWYSPRETTLGRGLIEVSVTNVHLFYFKVATIGGCYENSARFIQMFCRY